MSVRDRWLLSQLPDGMLADDFFARFVSIFQEEATGLLEHADQVVHLVDPTVAPLPMVRWTASWLGMAGIDAGLDEQVQRRLVATAARTLPMRGTTSGLQAFLELFTGGPAEVRDGGGVWREGQAPGDHAWVQMRVGSTGSLTDAELVALLADHVPAHVRAELWVGDRQIWPAGGAGAAAGPQGAPRG